jgi:hypothetical protein
LPSRVISLPIKRRKRALTLADAEAVAALVAKRASECEACAFLGIPISTWAHFKMKNRNSALFIETLDRLKAAKIEAHLSNIEAFSAKDWRASEAYLEKVMPERFSAKAAVNVVTVAPVADMDTLRKLAETIYGEPPPRLAPPPARLIEAGDTKEPEP